MILPKKKKWIDGEIKADDLVLDSSAQKELADWIQKHTWSKKISIYSTVKIKKIDLEILLNYLRNDKNGTRKG